MAAKKPSELTSSIQIPVPQVVTETAKAAHQLATTAPHWVCLLAVVGGFLWYLDRHDQKEHDRDERNKATMNLASTLRIDTCHDVQERSVDAIERLNETLGKQSETFREMDATFEMLMQAINNHAETHPDRG